MCKEVMSCCFSVEMILKMETEPVKFLNWKWPQSWLVRQIWISWRGSESARANMLLLHRQRTAKNKKGHLQI